MGLTEGPSVKQMKDDRSEIKVFNDLKLIMTDDKGYDPSKCLSAFKKNINIDANNKADVCLIQSDGIFDSVKITSLAGVNYNATIVAKNKLNECNCCTRKKYAF